MSSDRLFLLFLSITIYHWFWHFCYKDHSTISEILVWIFVYITVYILLHRFLYCAYIYLPRYLSIVSSHEWTQIRKIPNTSVFTSFRIPQFLCSFVNVGNKFSTLSQLLYLSRFRFTAVDSTRHGQYSRWCGFCKFRVRHPSQTKTLYQSNKVVNYKFHRPMSTF